MVRHERRLDGDGEGVGVSMPKRAGAPSSVCVCVRARALCVASPLTHSVGEELEVAAVRERAEADEEDLLRSGGDELRGWDFRNRG